MYLEVTEASGGDNILEVFFADTGKDMGLTLFKPSVPIEVVEWALSVAKVELPPTLNTSS